MSVTIMNDPVISKKKRLNGSKLYDIFRSSAEAGYEVINGLAADAESGELTIDPEGRTLEQLWFGCTGRPYSQAEWQKAVSETNKREFVGAETPGGNAIGTGAFSLVLSNMVRTEYQKRPAEKLICDQLVMKEQASQIDTIEHMDYYPTNEPTDDRFVREGQPYPNIGAKTGLVQMPPVKKDGVLLEVTRELVFNDPTGGKLLRFISSKREGLWKRRELRFLGEICGTTTGGVTWTFSKADNVAYYTQYNTYANGGSTPYTNIKTSNALADHTSIETALKLMRVNTDPMTGAKIAWGHNLVMLVPTQLEFTAKKIIAATQIAIVDNTVASPTYRAYTPNPEWITNIRVMSSVWLDDAIGSTTTWYLMDPAFAFVNRSCWSMQYLDETLPERRFTHDIVAAYRADYAERCATYNPCGTFKNTA